MRAGVASAVRTAQGLGGHGHFKGLAARSGVTHAGQKCRHSTTAVLHPPSHIVVRGWGRCMEIDFGQGLEAAIPGADAEPGPAERLAADSLFGAALHVPAGARCRHAGGHCSAGESPVPDGG